MVRIRDLIREAKLAKVKGCVKSLKLTIVTSGTNEHSLADE